MIGPSETLLMMARERQDDLRRQTERHDLVSDDERCVRSRHRLRIRVSAGRLLLSSIRTLIREADLLGGRHDDLVRKIRSS
jgi:hypothetical protein